MPCIDVHIGFSVVVLMALLLTFILLIYLSLFSSWGYIFIYGEDVHKI